MGKAKPRKRFTGGAARSNPEGVSVVAEEETIDAGSDDVWQHITEQLQSGEKFYLKMLMDLFSDLVFVIQGHRRTESAAVGASISWR